MKVALTSINPPHTNNIFEKIKGIEWRTKPMPMGKHYCYETKKCFGLGKVIGEFHIWRIKRYEHIWQIPEEFIEQGCVPIEFLEAYSKGRPLYAHFIISPKRYDKPRELSEFKKAGFMTEENWLAALYPNTHCHYEAWAKKFEITKPPQSWCYVESEVQGNDIY